MKLEQQLEVGGNAEQVAGRDVVNEGPSTEIRVEKNNGGQIAAKIINIDRSRPFLDPRYVRPCPECGTDNQLHADKCWVCALDFGAWTLARQKDRVVKRSFAGALAGLGCAWGSQFVLLKPLALGLFAVGALLVFVAIHAIKES